MANPFKAIGNFFKKFWTMFRPGLWQFLENNIAEAVDDLEALWISKGRPVNLISFVKEAEAMFKNKFNTDKGTWTTALLMLAWDALKNNYKLP
jgi:biotin-(acetyl-CoA carboxylase) ligase